MGDAIPVPVELVALGVGAVAFFFMRWVDTLIAQFKARHAEQAGKVEEVEDTGRETTVRLSVATATILAEMQEHRRRIDALEADGAEHGGMIQEVDRRAVLHAEQTRNAISDVATLKSDMRNIMDKLVRFEVALESSIASAAKLDRLYDLFERGLARARA